MQTALLNVDVMEIQKQPYQIKIESYEMVLPQIKIILIVQVSGQIMSIISNFNTWSVFEKGEEWLKIDERDYQANLNIVKAYFIKSNQYLIEEEARSIQAARNRERLGNKGDASNLILHKPQLNIAKAVIESSIFNFIRHN